MWCLSIASCRLRQTTRDTTYMECYTKSHSDARMWHYHPVKCMVHPCYTCTEEPIPCATLPITGTYVQWKVQFLSVWKTYQKMPLYITALFYTTVLVPEMSESLQHGTSTDHYPVLFHCCKHFAISSSHEGLQSPKYVLICMHEAL